MDALATHQLTKHFGSNTIIDNLSFSVPEHSVFGFLGQNGAGKTTTMKMVLGLLKPDGGEIKVFGENVTYGQTSTNRHIGYLPDVPEFYSYMRPKEYLRLCGEITGMGKQDIKRKSEELLSLVGLEKMNRKIGGFSRGMKQRLGIAQALLNEPKLLICDEPTSALDPIGRKEILDILGQVKDKTTVIFSTHILSDVERICDRIAVLHNGGLALSGTIAELKQEHRQDSLLVEFPSTEEGEMFRELLKRLNLLDRANCQEMSFLIKTKTVRETQALIMEQLHQNQLLPSKLEVMEPTLESLFLEVVS
ncbi:MAG TPA: ABC transporter ATP-binding protein [Lachnospiraceae bacterium]|nr:ABC transporter ATP-binding protein [Lachnospiraceae bacterium]